MVESDTRELSEAKRFQIFCELKSEWDGKKFRWGAKGEIAVRHNVSVKTVSKYWKLGHDVSEPEEAEERKGRAKKDRYE